ncbi:hypothetical protein JNW90_00765 [Micromonospora sp. STR1s_5]|nr:hypothetical protein [Micromonospora sp. STR1s_5]
MLGCLLLRGDTGDVTDAAVTAAAPPAAATGGQPVHLGLVQRRYRRGLAQLVRDDVLNPGRHQLALEVDRSAGADGADQYADRVVNGGVRGLHQAGGAQVAGHRVEACDDLLGVGDPLAAAEAGGVLGAAAEPAPDGVRVDVDDLAAGA